MNYAARLYASQSELLILSMDVSSKNCCTKYLKKMCLYAMCNTIYVNSDRSDVWGKNLLFVGLSSYVLSSYV